ncbi:MAG: hypothetical protein ACLTDF_05110 [Coprococcus sp.]
MAGNKRKILTCASVSFGAGYKNTVSQIVDEVVARKPLNLFPTKDRILLELTETMFGGQFGKRSIADSKLPPVYAYAVENGDSTDTDRAE